MMTLCAALPCGTAPWSVFGFIASSDEPATAQLFQSQFVESIMSRVSKMLRELNSANYEFGRTPLLPVEMPAIRLVEPSAPEPEPDIQNLSIMQQVALLHTIECHTSRFVIRKLRDVTVMPWPYFKATADDYAELVRRGFMVRPAGYRFHRTTPLGRHAADLLCNTLYRDLGCDAERKRYDRNLGSIALWGR